MELRRQQRPAFQVKSFQTLKSMRSQFPSVIRRRRKNLFHISEIFGRFAQNFYGESVIISYLDERIFLYAGTRLIYLHILEDRMTTFCYYMSTLSFLTPEIDRIFGWTQNMAACICCTDQVKSREAGKFEFHSMLVDFLINQVVGINFVASVVENNNAVYWQIQNGTKSN